MRTIVAVMVLVGMGAQARGQEQHPRLFMTPERVRLVQIQAKVSGSHHQVALAELKARVEEPDIAKAYGDNTSYRQGYKAVEAAFLSLVTPGEAQKKQYAGIAFQMLDTWGSSGSATLGKSMESRCTALAYDWAWPAWTDAERAKIRKRVDAALAALAKITHSNLGGDRSSNFVGVIRGAELLLHLSAGADLKQERVQVLIGELKRHLAHFGSLGVTQEGPGYTEYPGGFLLPCVLATKELGDSTLADEAARHAFWKLALYTRTFMPMYNKGLMWGVGSGSNYNEGWASLLLALCPADQLPYYVYWYDRHVGRMAAAPNHRFDSDRHGTVWALLFYPADLAPKDPTGVFPPAAADSRGDIFFRNRWLDADDVLVSLSAQAKKDQKGWNQPEQLAINLMGFGSRFIGGPSKATQPGVYSALLVDGQYTYKNATERMGKVLAFEPGKAGGYAIVQGGQMYEVLGVKEAARHMLVEFLPSGQAIVATLDRVKGAGEHTYTWQANVGPAEALTWVTEWWPGHEALDAADNIKAGAGTEAGRPTFLLKGRRDGFTKGWVLTPADAQVRAGDPLQISTKGTDADILVVMVVGRGTPPQGRVAGRGLESRLQVAGRQIGFDAGSGRLVSAPADTKEAGAADGRATWHYNHSRPFAAAGNRLDARSNDELICIGAKQ